MSNIFKFTKKENKNYHYFLPRKYQRVKVFYDSLVNSGYSPCQGFHEAMKLLFVASRKRGCAYKIITL